MSVNVERKIRPLTLVALGTKNPAKVSSLAGHSIPSDAGGGALRVFMTHGDGICPGEDNGYAGKTWKDRTADPGRKFSP